MGEIRLQESPTLTSDHDSETSSVKDLPVAINHEHVKKSVAKRSHFFRRKLESPARSERQNRRIDKILTKSFSYFEKNPPIDITEYDDLQKQEAMVTCRTLIESYIGDKNFHGESRAELKGMVEVFSKKYGFDDVLTKDIVDSYYDHWEEAHTLREQYKDDRALVRQVTGVDISDNANVKVVEGSWGLVIVGDNDLTNNILYRGKMPPTDFVAGGLAEVDHLPPFLLLNEGQYDPATQEHEEQHMRYAITKNVFERHTSDVSDAESIKEMSVPLQHGQIEDFLRGERMSALDRAKDEIFAYSFNADHFPIEFFTARNGNPYDYLGTKREWYADDPLYAEASQRIFVSEYDSILSTAAASFDLLMKRGGYSNEEAIALLADQSLDQWVTIAKKIFDAKDITLSKKEESTISHVPDEKPYERRPRSKTFTRHHKKPEQFMDVVITKEDTDPDWYRERNEMGIRKETERKSSDLEDTIDQSEVDTITFTIVNKLLYDRTRAEVEQRYTGQDLKDYFEVLDKVASERTKAFITSGKFDNEDILLAVGIVLSQLEQTRKRAQI